MIYWMHDDLTCGSYNFANFYHEWTGHDSVINCTAYVTYPALNLFGAIANVRKFPLYMFALTGEMCNNLVLASVNFKTVNLEPELM